MESGPAIFAGTVFSLFGAALVLSAAVRSAWHVPVAPEGADPGVRALRAFAGVAFLVAGVWCLLHS